MSKTTFAQLSEIGQSYEQIRNDYRVNCYSYLRELAEEKGGVLDLSEEYGDEYEDDPICLSDNEMVLKVKVDGMETKIVTYEGDVREVSYLNTDELTDLVMDLADRNGEILSLSPIVLV